MMNMTYQKYFHRRLIVTALSSCFILVGCDGQEHSTSESKITTSVQNELRSIEVTESSLRWYEDNNLGVAGEVPLDFYSRMSTPEDWEQSLKIMDVFYLRSESFWEYLSNNLEFAQELALLLAKHNIALAVDETAATWAHSELPDSPPQFSESIAMLSTLTNAGFDIRYISLQSVLSKPLPDGEGNIIEYSYEQRYSDISSYITQVTALYPNIAFGIIDALPARTSTNEYQAAYQGLFDHLAENNLHLDYLHLDLPLNLINQKESSLTPERVKQVREFVTKTLDWRFGWFITDRIGGNSDAGSFAKEISQGLINYLSVDGKADDYVLSSWFPYPQFTVPDQYSSSMPAFATFRMMDQILNVAGNTNNKQCTFEVAGDIADSQSWTYVNYQTVQNAPLVYRLYCDPAQNITLTDGSEAKPTQAIYQCMNLKNGYPYLSKTVNCTTQETSEPQRIGFLFSLSLPGTTPLYLCQDADGEASNNCNEESESKEILGYF
ncbi:hypothetical protein [Vibrio sp. B1FLJ16]|uniref:hypothetical protein n=1 Tax=Vibrio sp. B1FLJ16 TaxID=2751178 RepID=UPI0015F4F1CE|nr:hypothetical protein [Vibrio sp. B1FLJ16]CAD7807299.1 hypothetical protein ACOMICROBIO_EPCKBFOG_01649 [Vibrio sp. B1FLJ16]CAE6905312.1 hypothetical protein ACOMICROBIO_EPCKBFOG_01649 [Vibrio sp. B1FLJ16]